MSERNRSERVSRGRRKIRFRGAAQVRAAGAEEGDPRPLAPLVFEHRFADGRTISVDLSNLPSSRLVRSLAAAFRLILDEPSGPNSPGAAKKYAVAIRKFVHFLGENTVDEIYSVSDLKPSHVNDFEDRLREHHPGGSQEPYQKTLRIVTLLRIVAGRNIENLGPDLTERLGYVANGEVGKTKPLDSLSPSVHEQLRRACRKEIKSVIRRLTHKAEEHLTKGQDPRVGGWSNPDNLLWEIVRAGRIRMEDLEQEIGQSESRQIHLRNLYAMVYPSQRDLVPFIVLLALDTGIEIDCLKQLPIDCLQNASDGWATIEWRKRRAKGNEWQTLRVRDMGSTTPGGIIRIVLTLTRRVRQHLRSDRLWIHRDPMRGRFLETSFMRQGADGYDPVHSFVSDHNIVDDFGNPLVLDDLRRLRKTYKRDRYLASGGMLEDFAQGHTHGIAADHYADIPALEDTHESTVEEGAWDAVRPARLAAKVIPPDEEEQLQKNVSTAAELLNVSVEAAESVLSGGQDTFLASCRDFFNSPFDTSGEACSRSLWGCLDCPNAVITSRKLPNILLLLGHTIEQRELMSENEWREKWGRTYLGITTAVLPNFPSTLVLEAKAVAEGGDASIYLPPELLSY